MHRLPFVPKAARRFELTILGLIGLGILATGTTLAIVSLAIYAQARTDDRAPADALLVLGAAQRSGFPSRAFRARLDHAATLFQQGYSPFIVIVGGSASPLEPSEAEVGARYLQEKGIPPGALLAVPQGRNTWQSLEAASPFLREHRVQRVLLVSDGFHLFRSKMMMRKLGFDAVSSPTPTSPIRPGSALEYWYIAREAVASLFFLSRMMLSSSVSD